MVSDWQDWIIALDGFRKSFVGSNLGIFNNYIGVEEGIGKMRIIEILKCMLNSFRSLYSFYSVKTSSLREIIEREVSLN